ncbi:unnamed protein product [Didymodactylos carnosus]|uniref:Uncharacterized protein n=1 Tax=Didymodactylos carnosus TaxID=1234261 RepID=A0A814ULK2_9BILA|nr:unnamed protein product [Didymodactylos carnosus]CAF3937706.1 unnamed protein product [Didymodactylos carnosus]
MDEATFDKPGEAESLIGNKWSKHYTHDTENGRTVYYRCNNAKRRGPQCSASIYLLYHADSDKVTVYKTEADHDHHDDKCRGIDEKVSNVFDSSYNQIMCWAHMKRKVDNRVCHIDDKQIAKEIVQDIEMLQLSNSIEVFELASTLFIKKWNANNKQKNQSILDFLNYFDNE